MAMASSICLPPPPACQTSLLASLDCHGHIHLILGSNPLAAARVGSSLAAGASLSSSRHLLQNFTMASRSTSTAACSRAFRARSKTLTSSL